MVDSMPNSPTTYGISPKSKTTLNSPLSSLDDSDLTDSLSLSVILLVEGAAFEQCGGDFDLQEVQEHCCAYVNKNKQLVFVPL